MEKLLLPTKVEFLPGETKHSGSVVITPCHHGYGTTLGNTLRRVLLSSIPGAAVEAFKVKGVSHEFSAIDGVKEDMVEIMLNLKQLAVKVHVDEPVTLTITKKGVGPVTAGDVEKNSNVEIANPELVICNLTSDKNFEMEIIVSRGLGYKTVEEKEKGNYDLGTIAIDSVYSPIKDVGYSVEFTRVGDITNYEKLTINIETNGTIAPEEAVRQANKIIMDHFAIIAQAIPEVEAREVEMETQTGEQEETEEPVKEKKRKSKKSE